MRITLADIYHILLNIGRDYKERLLAATNTQTFALANGIEVRTIMCANLFAIAHRITGRDRRTAAEAELGRIETELKNKLIGMQK